MLQKEKVARFQLHDGVVKRLGGCWRNLARLAFSFRRHNTNVGVHALYPRNYVSISARLKGFDLLTLTRRRSHPRSSALLKDYIGES